MTTNTDTQAHGVRKNISDMKVGDRVVADTHWMTGDRYQTGEIVALSPPGWVNFRNDADGKVWATDPSNIRIVDTQAHGGGVEAVREALVEAEAAFEAIRIILVNELEEPVRGAFWRAVQARDASRAALAAAAASRGEDWRPVLTGMVAAMNKRDSDFGDGEIPSAHRSLMWRAEQLLASPAATSAEDVAGDEPACWTSEVSLKMAAQGLPAPIHAYPPPVEPVALYRQPLAKPESSLSRDDCGWPAGRFTVHDGKGEHDPCYVVMPGGAMIPFNHHPGKNYAGDFVDVARARFVAAACNASLETATSAETQGGDGVRGSELVRAASALLDNLWQEVWSHERTHQENWKEFNRKYPGVKRLRDARDRLRCEPGRSPARRGAGSGERPCRSRGCHPTTRPGGSDA